MSKGSVGLTEIFMWLTVAVILTLTIIFFNINEINIGLKTSDKIFENQKTSLDYVSLYNVLEEKAYNYNDLRFYSEDELNELGDKNDFENNFITLSDYFSFFIQPKTFISSLDKHISEPEKNPILIRGKILRTDGEKNHNIVFTPKSILNFNFKAYIYSNNQNNAPRLSITHLVSDKQIDDKPIIVPGLKETFVSNLPEYDVSLISLRDKDYNTLKIKILEKVKENKKRYVVNG